MRSRYQLFISFLLTGIIALIYLVEAGATFNHYYSHEHGHAETCIDHSDCVKDCAHFAKKAEKTCHGHFFNFMPQVSVQKIFFKASIFLETPYSEMIFSLVKQYSSSYKHLFTSRPPPFLV
ncbi:DUF2607 domain-containing protein [Candidatus Ornithobacterium hominis]|uniref:hypothetical protein n=1 Tax=Candidatus Ornithobacterium hominis TaxID=2497989 RepID=UPI0024BCA3B9|nr:hypothetical protein [Candidatus Ornithobacterium hominis]CAI9429974.1 DUF2607 domain-containing protein [Candidatus Ornithobacterium hominis]